MGNTKKILNNLTFIGKKLENIGVSIGDTIDYSNTLSFIKSNNNFNLENNKKTV